MALMPFLYGMLMSTPVWQHIFLLLAWFSLYLMTYPFLNLFKTRNRELNIKWSGIYAGASAVFAVPALWYNWQIIYFVIAMLPLLLVNIYYVKKKDERALLNDFAAIFIFAIAGMGAYYFSHRTFDHEIWLVALYPTLFFMGTTLYVKSVLRERKNPRYLWASFLFHLLCILLFLYVEQFWLALCYVPPFVRAMYFPKLKLSVKQVGIGEVVFAVLFFVMLLWTIN